ncbi:hypothetical protein [Sphingobacterium bovistauri]|uniref:Uncharacterized protein n=1 Tax=Sphingobacterium bovistauri TaxID=2781959 RepID=A0ABS7Z7Z3_9SPHI|nr:hypothetical protein [Sphingobacterium bovistauri]MCA5005667.1 hypothetical protein [Sphingobacterium bovistauri]
MKYQHKTLTNTKVLIKLIPETDVETNMLINLDMVNHDHEFTLHHYYQQGLSRYNVSAVLLKLDFSEFPTLGLCSFEVVIGLG